MLRQFYEQNLKGKFRLLIFLFQDRVSGLSKVSSKIIYSLFYGHEVLPVYM